MPRSLAGLTILVLDDNARVQIIWREILDAIGAATIAAADASAAQVLLTTHVIDLVVIDQHLADPQHPGSELARWMRASGDARLASIPIVACTSDETLAARATLVASGADAVLTKPVDVRAALLTLGVLARRRRRSAKPVIKSA